MDQINLIKSLIGKILSLKINLSLIKFSLSTKLKENQKTKYIC
jgi:hypothetical protein